MTTVMMTVAHGAFLDGGEFLVRHRHRPGEPDASLEFRGDLGGRLADGLSGGVAGLQRAVVEHRVHLDEAAQLAWLRRVALRRERARRSSPARP